MFNNELLYPPPSIHSRPCLLTLVNRLHTQTTEIQRGLLILPDVFGPFLREDSVLKHYVPFPCQVQPTLPDIKILKVVLVPLDSGSIVPCSQ